MIRGYYLITDSELSKKGNISDVKNALEANVKVVQYRSKLDDTEHILEEARVLKELCKDKAIFIINDRVDIALSVDADGVHLGQGDMPYETARDLLGKDKEIGVTVHNLQEAVLFEKKGADYLGVSPIFATSTKDDAGQPCGVEVIKEIRERCRIPLVAIGGIDLKNAKSAIDAGADAVCAISAVVTKDDVKNEILKFQRLFPNYKT